MKDSGKKQVQDVKEFQKRLNQAMELKNINGAELGRLINKSRSAVSQYRGNADTLPPYDVIVSMAEALNVPVRWLNLEVDNLNEEIEVLNKQAENEVLNSLVAIPEYQDYGNNKKFGFENSYTYHYLSKDFLKFDLNIPEEWFKDLFIYKFLPFDKDLQDNPDFNFQIINFIPSTVKYGDYLLCKSMPENFYTHFSNTAIIIRTDVYLGRLDFKQNWGYSINITNYQAINNKEFLLYGDNNFIENSNNISDLNIFCSPLELEKKLSDNKGSANYFIADILAVVGRNIRYREHKEVKDNTSNKGQ